MEHKKEEQAKHRHISSSTSVFKEVLSNWLEKNKGNMAKAVSFGYKTASADADLVFDMVSQPLLVEELTPQWHRESD